MTYHVETTPTANSQIDGLPRAGQLAYAAFSERIAEDPWEGVPWIERPSSTLRQAAFGEHGEGLAVYVIIDRDERVAVVKVLWAG